MLENLKSLSEAVKTKTPVAKGTEIFSNLKALSVPEEKPKPEPPKYMSIEEARTALASNLKPSIPKQKPIGLFSKETLKEFWNHPIENYVAGMDEIATGLGKAAVKRMEQLGALALHIPHLFGRQGVMTDVEIEAAKEKISSKLIATGGLQQVGYGIERLGEMYLFDKVVSEALVAAGNKVPAIKKALDYVSLQMAKRPWKIGWPLSVAKSYGWGRLIGALEDSKNKEEMMRNSEAYGNAFAKFQFFAYPIFTFFRPLFYKLDQAREIRLGKDARTTLESPEMKAFSETVGTKKILWFATDDPNKFIRVTSGEIWEIPKSTFEEAYKSAQTGLSLEDMKKALPVIKISDIESFHFEPSLFEKIKTALGLKSVPPEGIKIDMPKGTAITTVPPPTAGTPAGGTIPGGPVIVPPTGVPPTGEITPSGVTITPAGPVAPVVPPVIKEIPKPAPEIAPITQKAPLETIPEEKGRIIGEISKGEKELVESYKPKAEKVNEELGKIWSELEIAEAGEAIPIRDESGALVSWLGKESSFPDWIPADLRDKKLLEKVMTGLSDLNNIKYPAGNRSAQRNLYNIILDELDSRLGIDTSETRTRILENYEKASKGEITKGISRGLKGGERPPTEGEIIKETVGEEILEVPKEVQQKVDADWEDNYAEEYGNLENELQELTKKAKISPAAERTNLNKKINEIVSRQSKIEEEFLTKWRKIVKEGKPNEEEIKELYRSGKQTPEELTKTYNLSLDKILDIVGKEPMPYTVTEEGLEKVYQENKTKEEKLRGTPALGLSIKITNEGSFKKPVTVEHLSQLKTHFNNFKKRINEIISPLYFHKNAPPELKNAIRTEVIGGLNKVYETRNKNQIILWGGVEEKDIATSIELIRLRDQVARIKADKGNPNITLEEAQKALTKAEESASPEAKEAAERYRMLVKKYSQDLIERGKLDSDELLDDYMRHYVVDYTPDWIFNKGIPTRLRQPFRGYLKKAGRTTKEYRVDVDTILGQFLEVDHDNMIEDFIIKQAGKYDIKSGLNKEKLAEIAGVNKETGRTKDIRPGRIYEVGGKRYRGFNPSAPFGRVIFPTEEGVMALGRYRKTYLVPEEIYNTFREFSERGSAPIYYLNKTISYWKTMAILSHYPSFNINNMVGDTWMALSQSSDPHKVLKETPTALSYLTSKKPSEYLKELDKFIKDNDIVEGSYIEAELPKIRKASNPLLYILQKSQSLSQFRESILRTANASYLLKEIKKGNGPKLMEYYSYMNLKGLPEREALGKVAREILVDYKSTSKTFNRLVKGFIFPFGTWYLKGSGLIWSFTKRHWGRALLAFLAIPVLAAIWNDRSKETREMEGDLPDYMQNRTHFILGKNPDGTIKVLNLQLPQDALIGTKIFSIAVNQANLVVIGQKDVKKAAEDTLKQWGIKEAKGIAYMTNYFVRFIQGLINQRDPYDNAPIYSMPVDKMTEKRKLYEKSLYFLKTTFPVLNAYIKDYTLGNPIDLTKKDFIDRMVGVGALGVNDITPDDKIFFEGKKVEWEDIDKLKEIYGREMEILDQIETEWVKSGKVPEEFIKTEEFKKSLEKMRDMYTEYLPEYKNVPIWDIASDLGERLTNRLGNSTDSAKKWYQVQLERAKTDEEKRKLSEQYKKLRQQNMIDAINAYSKSSRDIFENYLKSR
jgi:hypothetical protein